MQGSAMPLVATCAVLVGVRVWYDIVQFLYFRERMRIYKTVAAEGVGVVRLAIERGCLSDVVLSHPRVQEFVRT